MAPRQARPKKFFSEQEQEAIVAAIAAAERRTSGEIRVHLEHHAHGDVYARAVEDFERLGMTETAERNGVLIYFATGDRQFCVLGDRGIDERVPDGFWDDVVALMSSHFRQGAFVAGMTLGIARIGEKLAEFFPYAGDDADENELSDEISHGD